MRLSFALRSWDTRINRDRQDHVPTLTSATFSNLPSSKDPAIIVTDIVFRSLIEHLSAGKGPHQETPANRGRCTKKA